MSDVMAVLCTNPGELSTVRRPRPRREEGEVLLRIRRVGICGTDYHIYEGKHPFLAYPRVMGHELAAEVVEAPHGSAFAAGDTVIVNPYLSCGACVACRNGKPNCCTRVEVLGVHRDGGMTEMISLPESNLIPAGKLGFDECATVEFLAIGAHAVRRAALNPQSRVLVVGAGPIGLGAAIFAGIGGGVVTLMDRDPGRLDAARSIAGSERVILAGDMAATEIARDTQGDGYDVVFDATGNRMSMEQGFDHVAHGGTYVLVSVVKDTISFSDPEFHKREMSLLGSRNATSEDFRHVADSLEAGLIPVDRIITHRTSLSGAVTDLPRWAQEKMGLVKAVIEVG